MPMTTRKYYFKPDAESFRLLPDLFKLNSRGINMVIAENRQLCSMLDEKRRADDNTKEAQSIIDNYKRLREAIFTTTQDEYGPKLEKLRHQRYACRSDKTRSAEIQQEYNRLKRELKELRQSKREQLKKELGQDLKEAYYAVEKANRDDYGKAWGQHFDAVKKTYTKETQYRAKYHIDDYNRRSLTQARKELYSNEAPELRKFRRGYGTQFPEFGSIVTGQSQSGGEDKKITVKQYREGAKGSSHVRTLGFPDPSAWDPNLPKGERRRKQYGPVEISLLGRRIKGTCQFHQPIPDDYCVVGAALTVEVRSGNTHFYLTLNFQHQSELDKNSFENRKGRIQEVSQTPISKFTDRDEIYTTIKDLNNYKSTLRKKINAKDTNQTDQAAFTVEYQQVEDFITKLKARSAEIRAAEKLAAKEQTP